MSLIHKSLVQKENGSSMKNSCCLSIVSSVDHSIPSDKRMMPIPQGREKKEESSNDNSNMLNLDSVV
jgi:hypothetical protein